MSQSIQAIYENGLLRPLTPLDLPENSVVEIDVRDVKENASMPNANALRVIKQVTEKQKDMRYTSGAEVQKFLRDARNGEMFGDDTK